MAELDMKDIVGELAGDPSVKAIKATLSRHHVDGLGDRLKVASLLCQQDAFPIAAEIYLDILATHPETQEAYLALAHRIHANDPGEAEFTAAQRLVALRPDDRAIRFSLARAYDVRGDPRAAFELLDATVAASVYLPYLTLFADLAMRLEEWDRSRPTIDRLVRMLQDKLRTAPGDIGNRTELVRLRKNFSLDLDGAEWEDVPDDKALNELARSIESSINRLAASADASHREGLNDASAELVALSASTKAFGAAMDADARSRLAAIAVTASQSGWVEEANRLFDLLGSTAGQTGQDVSIVDRLVGAGHAIEAERWLLTALASPRADIAALLVCYADFLLSQDRIAQANHVAKAALRHQKIDLVSLHALAAKAGKKDQNDIAELILNRIIAESPADRTARFALALLARARGAKEAYDVLRPTIQASTFPPALALFAEVSTVLHDFEAAKKTVDQLESIDDNGTPSVTEDAKRIGWAVRVILHSRAGRPAAALPPWSEPTTQAVRRLLARAMRELAAMLCEAMVRAGRLPIDLQELAADLLDDELAVTLLLEAAQKEADVAGRARVLAKIGRLYLRRFDVAKAVVHLRAALECKDSLDIARDLASALALTGQVDALSTLLTTSPPSSLPRIYDAAGAIARFDRSSDALAPQAPLVHRPYPRRRFFDCCILNDDIDALEIRLAELGEMVDMFVVLEAAFEADLSPKPVNFLKHSERFERYSGRLKYVAVRDVPVGAGRLGLRSYMRDLAVASLHDVAQGRDVVLVSDANEIPRASAVDEFLWQRWTGLATLDMPTFKYFLNYRVFRDDLGGSHAVIGRYDDWRSVKPGGFNKDLSALVGHQPNHHVQDAGWHLLGIGETAPKTMEDRIAGRSLGITREAMRRGEYCDSRGCAIPVDHTFPRLVRNHQDRFAPLLLKPDMNRMSDLLALLESDRTIALDAIGSGPVQ